MTFRVSRNVGLLVRISAEDNLRQDNPKTVHITLGGTMFWDARPEVLWRHPQQRSNLLLAGFRVDEQRVLGPHIPQTDIANFHDQSAVDENVGALETAMRVKGR